MNTYTQTPNEVKFSVLLKLVGTKSLRPVHSLENGQIGILVDVLDNEHDTGNYNVRACTAIYTLVRGTDLEVLAVRTDGYYAAAPGNAGAISVINNEVDILLGCKDEDDQRDNGWKSEYLIKSLIS